MNRGVAGFAGRRSRFRRKALQVSQLIRGKIGLDTLDTLDSIKRGPKSSTDSASLTEKKPGKKETPERRGDFQDNSLPIYDVFLWKRGKIGGRRSGRDGHLMPYNRGLIEFNHGQIGRESVITGHNGAFFGPVERRLRGKPILLMRGRALSPGSCLKEKSIYPVHFGTDCDTLATKCNSLDAMRHPLPCRRGQGDVLPVIDISGD